MRHDILSDMFCTIKNGEAIGKKECVVAASSLVADVLKIMQNHKYVGKVDKIDDGKGGRFRVELAGRINNCNAIRPRFSVPRDDFIKWEKKFLPASDVGILILTTPKGVMDQKEAKKQKVGGKLLGYVY